MPHATGSGDGGQEGCERGYYHLHHKLDNTLFVHRLLSSLFLFLVGGQRLDVHELRLLQELAA